MIYNPNDLPEYHAEIDWSKPTALFLGRFSPWNPGHRATFETMLRAGEKNFQGRGNDPVSKAKQVCIMVRDQGKDNFNEIKESIIESLEPDYQGKYTIMQVPDITDIFYGRQVSFDVHRVCLPSELEPVPGKKVRAEEQYYQQKFWANRQ